jgi:hypothetical protein
MANNDSLPLLKVYIKYKDLEASLEGDYSSVWKLSNDFLKGIRQNLDPSKPIFTIKDKSVPDILVDLRNSGFFNIPKSSSECVNRLKELGKTDITPSAVSMALKFLVERGELTRQESSKKPGQFLYLAINGD